MLREARYVKDCGCGLVCQLGSATPGLHPRRAYEGSPVLVRAYIEANFVSTLSRLLEDNHQPL